MMMDEIGGVRGVGLDDGLSKIYYVGTIKTARPKARGQKREADLPQNKASKPKREQHAPRGKSAYVRVRAIFARVAKFSIHVWRVWFVPSHRRAALCSPQRQSPSHRSPFVLPNTPPQAPVLPLPVALLAASPGSAIYLTAYSQRRNDRPPCLQRRNDRPPCFAPSGPTRPRPRGGCLRSAWSSQTTKQRRTSARVRP